MERRNAFLMGLLIMACGLSPVNGQLNIAEARGLPLGATVTIHGIATSGPELGTIRYVQDSTGGIAVYSTKLSGVGRGDSISVTGVLKDYVTLLELDPVDSVTIHSGGHELPEPLSLRPGQFEESYEGMLVSLKNAQFAISGQFLRTAYDIVSGGEEAQLYINSPSSPLIGTAIPVYPVTITGLLGSYNGTYQILPRDTGDLVLSSAIHVTADPWLSEIASDSLVIEWATDQKGSSEAFYGETPGLELGVLAGAGDTTGHALVVAGLGPSQPVYLQPFSVKGDDTARALAGVYMTRSLSSGEITPYFNRSVDHSVSLGILEAEQLVNGADEKLVELIGQATESIDLCIYNLNNQGISDISGALNQARQRGVVVRVIYDGDRQPAGIGELDPGIGKLASPPEDYPYFGIMHNKFVVMDALSEDPDKPLVWTGSMNFSYSQVNTDANNVVVIRDQSLARAYRMEFNEMFGSDSVQPDPQSARFGPQKSDNTPHQFVIGGIPVECYFSPSDHTNEKILKAIASAGHSLHVAAMLITREDLGEALEEKGTATGNVEVLLDGYDASGEPIVNLLKGTPGVDLRLKGEPGIMHHKYLIADQEDADSDPLVLTGSHNWSTSARDRNDENTLVIHDQGVANAYYQEFVARFAAGESLSQGTDGWDPGQPEKGWRVYPNPAHDRIHLAGPGENGIAAYRMMDSGGRVVLESEVPGRGSGGAFTVPVGHLPAGLYVIRILSGSGDSHTFRIVLQ